MAGRALRPGRDHHPRRRLATSGWSPTTSTTCSSGSPRWPDRLGCEDELRAVADIPRRGASYQRQRSVAAATGVDLVAVVDSVVRELREGLRS